MEFFDFFEGTEKLLEIWFTSENESEQGDLRNIPREELDELLNLVNCKILSFTKTDELDSYILSESSLFVSKNRWLLKTCGTTTLLNAVNPIIRAAFKFCGFDTVEDLFFSRKKFMRPELQKMPHCSFKHEVKFLEGLLGGGNAFILGTLNGECWYLYTLNKQLSIQEGDQTLEIIMTKLDRSTMDIFYQNASSSAADAAKRSGIDRIFPDAILDGHLFDPCGYSVNGILTNGYYFTIHITPEASCSYVSFETNAPDEDYPSLIRKVIDLFKPQQFIITCFANDNSVSGPKLNRKACQFDDFHFETYQETRVKNYNVTYAQYNKTT